MRFLDNQDAFLQSFGIAPVHLPEKQNNSKYSSCQRILRDYREKCKLDIFLHLCRLNYVGHGKIDVTMNTQEACKKILVCIRFVLLENRSVWILLKNHSIKLLSYQLVYPMTLERGIFSYVLRIC